MHLVTMGEAAQRLGISVDTIRRRLRRGELKGHLQLTPQGFIWLFEVAERQGVGTDVGHGPGKAPLRLASAPGAPPALRPIGQRDAAPAANEAQALRELVEVLRRELESRNQQLDSKDRQIEQLHALLQQAQSSPAPPGWLPIRDPGITGRTAGQSIAKLGG
jgi:hypothetical protein